MFKPEIIDNFLNQKEFDEIQTLMIGGELKDGKDVLPWLYESVIDYPDDLNKFQFVHFFYVNHTRLYYYETLNPIFQIIQPVAIFRIKANLLTRTSKIVENDFHIDISNYDDENRKTIFPEKLKQLTTAIFYVNTNNGYTKFEDGTKIESVANRIVFFPSNLKHHGTSCTDENIRVVINLNFFK